MSSSICLCLNIEVATKKRVHFCSRTANQECSFLENQLFTTTNILSSEEVAWRLISTLPPLQPKRSRERCMLNEPRRCRSRFSGECNGECNRAELDDGELVTARLFRIVLHGWHLRLKCLIHYTLGPEPETLPKRTFQRNDTHIIIYCFQTTC